MLRCVKNRERPVTKAPRWTRKVAVWMTTMSSLTTKDQFAFELPNLTYIDASLEEANFRAPALPGKRRGLMAMFRAWRERRAAIAELEMMSDHELSDIGLNRADVHRVFDNSYNQDLRDQALA